jgi:putative phage-type endonuclease
MRPIDIPGGQGSEAWHEHRRSHWNASEAPSMLGVSPYVSRSALLKAKATGVEPEVDASAQRLFDDGHRAEALARPLAEALLDDECLYPITVAKGRLSASLDGATLDGKTLWEHKLMSATLREALRPGKTAADLPEHYRIQMEQQLYCAEAERVLFMASEWDGDTLIEERHCWYTPDLELRARILLGWSQFESDLAAWTPAAPAAPAQAAAVIETLPALIVSVEGRVVSSNLQAFRERADAFLSKIRTDLQTDQDFADAESTVKFCKEGEERLELVKQQALAQTASIDELFRTIDHIAAQMREKRLALDKLVKARKDSIRGELVAGGQAELDGHTKALNQRLMAAWGPAAAWMPCRIAPFGDAIKGKKTVSSIKEAIGVMVANEKIAASSVADRLEVNRRALVMDGKDWMFLFADFATRGAAEPDAFLPYAKDRIAGHIEREAAAKAEAERQAAERAAQEAKAKPLMQDEAEGRGLSQALANKPDAPLHAREAAAVIADEKPTLTLGAIGDRLGFKLPEDFLTGLGFPPAARERSARLYRESQWPDIKRALIARIEAA